MIKNIIFHISTVWKSKNSKICDTTGIWKSQIPQIYQSVQHVGFVSLVCFFMYLVVPMDPVWAPFERFCIAFWLRHPLGTIFGGQFEFLFKFPFHFSAIICQTLWDSFLDGSVTRWTRNGCPNHCIFARNTVTLKSEKLSPEIDCGSNLENVWSPLGDVSGH